MQVTESVISTGTGPGIQGLIGMDIINTGDMAISNSHGKTIFTFAVPPFENRADYVAKANKLGPKK